MNIKILSELLGLKMWHDRNTAAILVEIDNGTYKVPYREGPMGIGAVMVAIDLYKAGDVVFA